MFLIILLKYFNRVKLDEQKWKNITQESERNLKSLTYKLEELKNKLLLNKFDENWIDVNCFKNIKMNFESMKINR